MSVTYNSQVTFLTNGPSTGSLDWRWRVTRRFPGYCPTRKRQPSWTESASLHCTVSCCFPAFRLAHVLTIADKGPPSTSDSYYKDSSAPENDAYGASCRCEHCTQSLLRYGYGHGRALACAQAQ